MASGGDFADWYKQIPTVTKYWFTGSIVVPLVAKFGIINPRNLIILFDLIFQKFQIWRLITGLLYYPITPQSGFSYLINLYFLYSYSSRLETGVFANTPADYLLMLIFNWFVLLIVAYFANLMLIFEAMILSVMYVWCQLNRDTIVQFWFGATFKAMYLPWVLLLFNMIIRGGGLIELVGIAVGHLYFFVKFKYPQDFNGVDVLKTPDFLQRWLPNRRGGIGGFGPAPVNRNNRRNDNDDDGARYRNVGGYRLGD